MKSDVVGTTLKHPETINGNVKNLILPFNCWKKFNFERYSIVLYCFIIIPPFRDVIPPFGDVFDVLGHVKVLR